MANTMVRMDKKTVCDKCSHKHIWGQPCHVLMPVAPLLDLDSSEEDSAYSEESDVDTPSELDEEEVEAMVKEAEEEAKAKFGGPSMMDMAKSGAKGMLKGAKAAAAGAKHGVHSAKMAAKRTGGSTEKLLQTPNWARDCGFKRCNCDYGVPDDNPDFVPLAINRFAGGICINTGECEPITPPKAVLQPPVDVLRGALPFLNPRSLAKAKRVGRLWNVEVAAQPHYDDMHRCDVMVQRVAHSKRIWNIMEYKGRCYTSGDNSIKVWDMTNLAATPLHTCARDTSPVSCCVEIESYMYTGSANGAVREWSLPHNVKKISFRSNMWEHNKNLNDMAHWRMGSKSHLFTVSDDRSCRVWDLEVHACVGIIEPKDRKSGTLRSVACSDDMLFIGSSNGQIYVYLTERACRRPDRHVCRLPAGPLPYCLQTTLTHGEEVISALEVGGYHHSDDLLFSGSYDGSVYVWALPEEGLEIEILHKFETAHALAVTSLVSSWAHLVTAGDDGKVVFYNLYSDDWDDAKEKQLQFEGRIKCLHIGDEDDIEQDVAYLFCGTNRGELAVVRLGAYV